MRALRIFGWAVGGLVGLLVVLFFVIQLPFGLRLIASMISSSTMQVSGVSGFLPTDIHVARVELKDKQGAWLTVDNARVDWSFASLFTGRVRVDTVAADKVDVLRAPLPSEETSSSASSSDGFTLPVGVDLKSFAVDDLHIGAPLGGGVDSRWKLAGSALLAADKTQSRLKLDMNRTDGPPAKLAADLGFSLDQFSVDGFISAEEQSKGGVVAALIGRPDIDRDSFKFTVKGDRANGTAELSVAAGDAVTSTGQANWRPAANGTAIELKVTEAAPGLPDSPLARLLHNPATVLGNATIDNAGVVTVPSLTLSIGPLKVEAKARYDQQADKLDATTTITTAEAGPLADLAGGVDWRNLRVDITAALTGVSKTPQGTIAVKGGADDVLARVLGDKAPPPGRVDVAAVLGLERDGRLVLRSLDTNSPLLAVKGSGFYTPSNQAGDGKFAVDLLDFAPLSALAGMPIAGRGHFDLTLAGKNGGGRIDWKGTLDDLSVPGMPPALAHESLALSGGVAGDKDQSWKLDDLKFAAKGLSAGISGQGRGHEGVIDLSVDLPTLGLVQTEVSGAASAKAKVTLKPNGGDIHLSANTSDLKRGDITSKNLALVLDTSLEGEAVKGNLKLDGDLAEQPLRLTGAFSRNADGGVQVPSLQGGWASASVDVKDLAVTPQGATGNGHLAMTRLDDLSALLGMPLAGALDLTVATEPNPAGKVTIALKGTGLKSGTIGAGNVQLDASVTDPMGLAVTEATLKADRLAGAADLNQANVTVKGDRQAFDVTARVAGALTNANLAARIEPTPGEIRVALQKLDARYQGVPVALTAPTRFKVMGARVALDPTSLRLGGGALRLSGVVDPAASDLTADLSGLPLSIVDTFAPGTGLDGVLQAKAHVTGALAAPNVQADYTVSGLKVKRPETALVPALAVKGTASMAGQQATFDANVTAGSGTQLGVKGKATLPQGRTPLSATVALSGSMDIAPFAPAAGNDLRNVAGILRPNLTINLNGNSMTGAGTITLSNAALYLPASGMRLTGGQANISVQGDTLQLQQLTFQTARNGVINATGTVRLDPAEGFPTEIVVRAQKALVASRPDMVATVSSDVRIAGSTARGFDVTGPITIDRAEIGVGGSQSASYPTLKVREINGGNAPDPAAPQPRPAPQGKPAPKPPEMVRLALDINAPQAVFVRGRGLDAEVGGKFTVTGNPSAPGVLGSLTLRRGTFNLLGHQLDFTRGNVTLASVDTIDPELDFAATTTIESTTIEVDITGTPSAPKITLVSTLPQDEAMAMLLFGKPSAGLSPTELLTAAQALAELTGGGSVDAGFLGKLRSGLGLDRLSVNSANSTGANGQTSSTTAVQGGRYVAPGVYVGAQQGASADSSRGIIEIEVFKHTKIEGAVGTDSNDKIGVKMEWDY